MGVTFLGITPHPGIPPPFGDPPPYRQYPPPPKCPDKRDKNNHGTELAMKVMRQARLELSGGSTPDQLRPKVPPPQVLIDSWGVGRIGSGCSPPPPDASRGRSRPLSSALTPHCPCGCRQALRSSRTQALYRRRIRPGSDVLDLMASFDSHLPPMPVGRVCGLGMNMEELRSNDRLAERVVQVRWGGGGGGAWPAPGAQGIGPPRAQIRPPGHIRNTETGSGPQRPPAPPSRARGDEPVFCPFLAVPNKSLFPDVPLFGCRSALAPPPPPSPPRHRMEPKPQ